MAAAGGPPICQNREQGISANVVGTDRAFSEPISAVIASDEVAGRTGLTLTLGQAAEWPDRAVRLDDESG